MTDPRYANVGHIFDRTQEECAELILAIAKARRFGLDNFHPTRPKLGNNAEQILHEIEDVYRVCNELREHLVFRPDARCSECGSNEAAERYLINHLCGEPEPCGNEDFHGRRDG